MSDIASQPGTVIEVDTECIHCGYNLRGLMRDGRCPECGSPVDDSIRGNLLRHADPDWLDRLRFGASLKLLNIALGLIVGIATGVLVTILGLPQVVLIAFGIAMSVLGLWASFAITTQEPRISLHEDPVTLRKVIRLCAVLGFGGDMLPEFRVSGSAETILYICAVILGLVGIVAIAGELVYFRRFARRIPDGKLERSTTVLLWAVPIAVGVGALIGFWTAAGGAGTVGAPAGGVTTTTGAPAVTGFAGAGFAVFACVGGIVGLVFFLWYIRVLTQYKNSFKQAAAESRAALAGTASGGTDDPPEIP